MSIVHRPLLYLLISFCCGIALGRHLAVEPLLLVVSVIILLAVLWFQTVRNRRSLLLPLATFVLLGALASMRIPDPDQPPVGIQELLRKKHVVLMGRITHSLERLPSNNRIRLRLEAFREGDSWHTVSGNLLLIVRDCRHQWEVGQRLLGKVRIKAVRNFNNPGGFNYRQHLANQHFWLRGYARSDTYLIPLGRAERSLSYFLDRVRFSSRIFIEGWLPPDLAGIYRALLLGERYAISIHLRELLYNAGIGHILAISGLHIGLVVGFGFLAFHFILVRIPSLTGRWGARPLTALAAFPAAIAYGLLTGMALPALRATLMLGALTLALVLQREKDILNSLLLAALLILACYPEALFAASFQLSFIGVASLVCILPILPVPAPLQYQHGQDEKWRRLGRRFYLFTCGSLILSLFTAPVVLYHFHRLTPSGLLTNLIAVPLVGFLVLPAGLLALCSLPISTFLAGFLLTLGALGLNLLVTVAVKIASFPWTSFWPGSPKAWQVGITYVLLLVPFVRITPWRRAGVMVAGCLLLLASWMTPRYLLSTESLLRVTYLDVGQGNSAVVEFPGGGVLLVDGGGFHGGSFDVGQHVVAPYLWHRRFHRLEAMVLSHAHPDHFRGLNFIATHFSVGQFWNNKLPNGHPDFVQLMNKLAQKNIACLGPQDLSSLHNIRGVEVQLLHPPPHFSPDPKIPSARELNNHSLVLRLNYKNISFLFPGDIEKETEYRLASQHLLEPVDVLLVPHHGSRTSSSLRFLRRLKPQIAVFSVGFDNPFRLPSGQVLERYRELGVNIYRTDHHGAITISTDGEKIEVDTFLQLGKAGKNL